MQAVAHPRALISHGIAITLTSKRFEASPQILMAPPNEGDEDMKKKTFLAKKQLVMVCVSDDGKVWTPEQEHGRTLLDSWGCPGSMPVGYYEWSCVSELMSILQIAIQKGWTVAFRAKQEGETLETEPNVE